MQVSDISLAPALMSVMAGPTLSGEAITSTGNMLHASRKTSATADALCRRKIRRLIFTSWFLRSLYPIYMAAPMATTNSAAQRKRGTANRGSISTDPLIMAKMHTVSPANSTKQASWLGTRSASARC